MGKRDALSASLSRTPVNFSTSTPNSLFIDDEAPMKRLVEVNPKLGWSKNPTSLSITSSIEEVPLKRLVQVPSPKETNAKLLYEVPPPISTISVELVEQKPKARRFIEYSQPKIQQQPINYEVRVKRHTIIRSLPAPDTQTIDILAIAEPIQTKRLIQPSQYYNRYNIYPEKIVSNANKNVSSHC